jgi:hypothetical protein
MSSFYFNSDFYKSEDNLNENNNYNSRIYNNKKLSKSEILQNREKQSLKFLYDMLGRLLETAENYAFKDNEIKNVKKKYKYYDAFNNSEKKSSDIIKNELISSIEFFQCALNRYKKRFGNFNLPDNINDIYEDLERWKNYFPEKKIHSRILYSSIKDLLKGKLTEEFDFQKIKSENLIYDNNTVLETEADFKLFDNKHKNNNTEYESFISELYTIVFNAKNFYKSYNPHQSEKIFKINKNELKSFLKKYEKILNECKTSNHLIPYDLKKEYYNFEKYRLDFCEKDKKIFKYFNKICDILI